MDVCNFLDKRIDKCKVLVVGDIMLDRYYFGDVRRISPEAPVPVAIVKEVKETLGGAANVGNNLARLGCQVYLVGVTGNDHMRTNITDLLREHSIDDRGVIIANDRPTISKTRVFGGHQQILRLDFEDVSALKRIQINELKRHILNTLAIVDSVIISDYAKGVCSPEICKLILQECAKRSIPVVVDPKGASWRKYKGAFLITPNLKELGEAVRSDLVNQDADVQNAAAKLRSRFQIENLIVTRSEKGLSLVGPSQTVHFPTMAREVFDVSGAGDTVVAVLGAALADRMPLNQASQLANLAAGVVVGKIGTYAISRRELQEAATTFFSGSK